MCWRVEFGSISCVVSNSIKTTLVKSCWAFRCYCMLSFCLLREVDSFEWNENVFGKFCCKWIAEYIGKCLHPVMLNLSISFCYFILFCGPSRTPYTFGSFCSCKCWKGTGKGEGEGTGKGEGAGAGKRTRTGEGENLFSPCWTLSSTRWVHIPTFRSVVL